jgi:hypothetical protein
MRILVAVVTRSAVGLLVFVLVAAAILAVSGALTAGDFVPVVAHGIFFLLLVWLATCTRDHRSRRGSCISFLAPPRLANRRTSLDDRNSRRWDHYPPGVGSALGDIGRDRPH